MNLKTLPAVGSSAVLGSICMKLLTTSLNQVRVIAPTHNRHVYHMVAAPGIYHRKLVQQLVKRASVWPISVWRASAVALINRMLWIGIVKSVSVTMLNGIDDGGIDGVSVFRNQCL